jgi:hypothetical protein
MKRDRHFAEVNFIKRRRRDERSGETSDTGKDDRRQKAAGKVGTQYCQGRMYSGIHHFKAF